MHGRLMEQHKLCLCFQSPDFNAGKTYFLFPFFPLLFHNFFSFLPFLHSVLVERLFSLCVCTPVCVCVICVCVRVGQNVCDFVCLLYRADNVNSY